MFNEKRFLVIGAHPDDADLVFGGTALKLTKAGHQVKFVSVANGDGGHQSMDRKELAERRYAETQASAKIAGLEEYQVLDNSDCTLEASLENRAKIVRIIREFEPDVVISHRIYDYHADHRATSQLVQDASFMVTVPLYCPEVPVPDVWPVFAYSWDRFQQPVSFRADATVIIDDVIGEKLAMMNCHTSQFYEWLPWNKGYKDFNVNTMTEEQKVRWLTENWLCRNAKQAEIYLPEDQKAVYVESFEQSEYGRMVSTEEFARLFSC